MKSILYVGATLMIGASIYGFVDYKKTSQSKEFKTLYAEPKEEQPEAVVTDNKIIPAEEKTTVAKQKITARNKKESTKEEVAPAIKPIDPGDRLETVKKDIPADNVTTVAPAKENIIVKTVKKKRRFSTKLFSRGALDERYIEPVKEAKKSGTKKTEDKEQ
jgi:hypothetical protein